MTYVGAVPTTGDFKKLDAITASATATYNLRQGGVAVFPQSNFHCLVVLNGILQTGGSSFNIVNDTIVFAEALTSSDVINQILVLGNVNDIGVPSDDTVSQAKIQSEAINESKMQISNAGSNGQFLSKQSGNTGGLTWADAGGGKILQAVYANHATETSSTDSSNWTDTGLTASITPSATSSKILYIISQQAFVTRASSLARAKYRVVRDSTVIFGAASWTINMQQTGSDLSHSTMLSFSGLDSPSSTSALAFKTQMQPEASTTVKSQQNTHWSTITLLEVGA